ncbi:hypothetical protein DRW41_21640 [Neobacillus piezotolerans]|uniref:Uncharacterized protein n=1 Tax=Neobacillus piezotolerans TaxID=2259171 RepID=A0A3D8GK23_9BACI|nr:hypothetical protein [Neobacillus piezotolerans]RDU34805.1 hypothetical protein DRW41_21640 [Neobacillus piezotolerans]
MKPLRLNRLGNLLMAGGLMYKKLGRLTSGTEEAGSLLKKEEHLEEPGTLWYSKTAGVKPGQRAIRIK